MGNYNSTWTNIEDYNSLTSIKKCPPRQSQAEIKILFQTSGPYKSSKQNSIVKTVSNILMYSFETLNAEEQVAEFISHSTQVHLLYLNLSNVTGESFDAAFRYFLTYCDFT